MRTPAAMPRTIYALVAKRAEREAEIEFGEAYRGYAAHTARR